MINYQVEKFKNGLTLITAPMKETQAVSLAVAIKVGSRYEAKDQNGISHFLEHLFFKGTKKRPSKLLVAQELDGLGANYNALTSEEATVFYIQAAAEKFPQILDILSDMLLNPLMPLAEIELEKGVIAQEIKMYRDDPMLHVQDLAKELTFGDTPLGRNVAGTLKTVGQVNQTAIKEFMKKFYQPTNMVVAVTGNPKNFNWAHQIGAVFGGLGAKTVPSFEAYRDRSQEPKVLVAQRKTDQAHLILNCLTFSKKDPKRFPLALISKILGGYMSSRLFLKIREERGLAYYVRSGTDAFHDTGLFQASAGLKTQALSEAIAIILGELADFKADKITDQELSRAKENFRGEMSLRLEDSFMVAFYLLDEYCYFGKIHQPEELVKKIFAVDRETIKRTARQVFVPRGVALTVLGPYDKLKMEAQIKKILQKI